MTTLRRARATAPTDAVCTRCKGSMAPTGGARASYDGMIARFRVLGYPQCPWCRNYVLTLAGCPCRATVQTASLPLAA